MQVETITEARVSPVFLILIAALLLMAAAYMIDERTWWGDVIALALAGSAGLILGQ